MEVLVTNSTQYSLRSRHYSYLFFFFNDTATTEIYTLSLHDALPICASSAGPPARRFVTYPLLGPIAVSSGPTMTPGCTVDRKSTRLNSSHANISYAVFCLKKKKTKTHV